MRSSDLFDSLPSPAPSRHLALGPSRAPWWLVALAVATALALPQTGAAEERVVVQKDDLISGPTCMGFRDRAPTAVSKSLRTIRGKTEWVIEYTTLVPKPSRRVLWHADAAFAQAFFVQRLAKLNLHLDPLRLVRCVALRRGAAAQLDGELMGSPIRVRSSGGRVDVAYGDSGFRTVRKGADGEILSEAFVHPSLPYLLLMVASNRAVDNVTVGELVLLDELVNAAVASAFAAAAPVAPVAPVAPPAPVAPVAPPAPVAPVAPPAPVAPVAPPAPVAPVAPLAPPIPTLPFSPTAPAVSAAVTVGPVAAFWPVIPVRPATVGVPTVPVLPGATTPRPVAATAFAPPAGLIAGALTTHWLGRPSPCLGLSLDGRSAAVGTVANGRVHIHVAGMRSAVVYDGTTELAPFRAQLEAINRSLFEAAPAECVPATPRGRANWFAAYRADAVLLSFVTTGDEVHARVQVPEKGVKDLGKVGIRSVEDVVGVWSHPSQPVLVVLSREDGEDIVRFVSFASLLPR